MLNDIIVIIFALRHHFLLWAGLARERPSFNLATIFVIKYPALDLNRIPDLRIFFQIFLDPGIIFSQYLNPRNLLHPPPPPPPPYKGLFLVKPYQKYIVTIQTNITHSHTLTSDWKFWCIPIQTYTHFIHNIKSYLPDFFMKR